MQAFRVVAFACVAVAVTVTGVPARALASVLPPLQGPHVLNSGNVGYGTVAFHVTVPRPPAQGRAPARAGASSLHRVRPRFVSPSTKSFAILTDGKNPVVANVNPVTGEATVYLQVPVGTHTFTVTAYDAPGAIGNALSTGTTAPVYVPATGGVTIALTLAGIVASVVLELAHVHATIGSPAVIDLEVLAKDADGNTIAGPDGMSTPLAQPFLLTSSDPVNGKLSQTIVSSSINEQPQYFQRVSVAYSGANVSSITFSASGAGIKSVSPAVLGPLPAPTSGEQLIVTGGSDMNASFSTSTGQLLATLGLAPLAVDTYAAAAVDDTARLAYVADYGNLNGGGIDIIQTNGDFAQVDSFNPLKSFEGLAVDPIGKRLFATDLSSNVWIYSNASGHALLGTIPVGAVAAGIAVDPIAQRLYVGACGFEGSPPGCPGVQVFSTVPPYTQLYKSTTGQYIAAALDPVGGRLYLSEQNQAYIDVYNTSNLNTLVARIGPLGPLGPFPNAIAVDVKGRRLYVLGAASSAFPFATIVQVYGIDAGFPFLGTLPTRPGGMYVAVGAYGP